MSGCPLCKGHDLFVFLERNAVPVHQNLLMDSPSAARAITRGALRIACCRHCGFVTNTAFREDLLQYGETYENDQTCSPTFDLHVENLVNRLVAAGVRRKFIVEVGCGRGSFLRRLCERGESTGIGFDPSYVGPEVVDDGRVTFVREYYGLQHADVRPDVVVCRHVIEHVPNPLDLLDALRVALDGRKHAELAFETPTVEWILEDVVVQDFFYEHCSYFSAESLAYAFECAGFSVRSIDRVFGGQYLLLLAAYDGLAKMTQPPKAPSAKDIIGRASRYRDKEAHRIAGLRSRLEDMRRSGPIAVWGAGAKGVTFLQLVDPDATIVDCVVDINPRKQKKFIAGTGHPIVGVSDLRQRDVRSAVVMNANYANEIRSAVAQEGLNVAIEVEGSS